MRKSKILSALLVVGSLAIASAVHAFNFGNMMNPSKWMGGNSDRYDDYGRYGYGGPYGYGAPYGGYGAPYGYGYPGYGYGAPGYGYGYGTPGYGYGAPGYYQPQRNEAAPAPLPQ